MKKKVTTQQFLTRLEGARPSKTEAKIFNVAGRRFPTAFTLTELVITTLVTVIIISTLGIVLADSHRGWNRMYNHVHSDVVSDSHVAKRVFNVVVRKSSTRQIDLGDNGEFVKVYYYKDLTSHKLDKYATFYTSGGRLLVNYGLTGTSESSMSASNTSRTTTLAHNVKSASFSVNGASVQMILELDNGREALTVTCSAIRHNP